MFYAHGNDTKRKILCFSNTKRLFGHKTRSFCVQKRSLCTVLCSNYPGSCRAERYDWSNRVCIFLKSDLKQRTSSPHQAASSSSCFQASLLFLYWESCSKFTLEKLRHYYQGVINCFGQIASLLRCHQLSIN